MLGGSLVGSRFSIFTESTRMKLCQVEMTMTKTRKAIKMTKRPMRKRTVKTMTRAMMMTKTRKAIKRTKGPMRKREVTLAREMKMSRSRKTMTRTRALTRKRGSEDEPTKVLST
ncbi:unnamed protein product [Linum trigynum]|uniref:Uncharacterized protein n=1 Tax=Linum trigynum TaxID=586398 RepID=A0AAV2FUY1_9ROSI